MNEINLAIIIITTTTAWPLGIYPPVKQGRKTHKQIIPIFCAVVVGLRREAFIWNSRKVPELSRKVSRFSQMKKNVPEGRA